MIANGYGGMQRARRTNSLAIASLVLGILGVSGGFPLGIVAIVAGRRAIRAISQTGEDGYGIARAGSVLGWISVWLAVPLLLMVLVSH